MAVTDDAVVKIRELIMSGKLQPGDRLPQESALADSLGISRNSMREAVRTLTQARVLDVRHGSGTYVTSLEPSVLLEGISVAIEMVRDDTLAEVIEIRQLLEPAATALATQRMTPESLEKIRAAHRRMENEFENVEELVRLDLEFHAAIVEAAGNATLSSILEGLSSRTVRVRIWSGIMSDNSVQLTIDYHEQILRAIESGDPILAHAAALMHVTHARRWLDAALAKRPKTKSSIRQN